MAVIPTLNAPTVAPGGAGDDYMRAAAPAEAFGGNVGQAMQQFGGQTERMGNVLAENALQLQTEANKVSADDLLNSTMGKLNDAAMRYRQLEGVAAVNGLQDHNAEIGKIRDAALASATNPQLRDMVRRGLDFTSQRILLGSQEYAARQFKVGQERSAASTIAASTQFAVNNYNDPKILAATEARVVDSARRLADAHGLLPGEETDAFLSQERGKFWTNVLEDMATRGQIAQAQETLKQVRDRIDGASQLRLDQFFRAKADQGVAAGAATSAWMTAGGTLGSAIQQAAANNPGANQDTLLRTAALESNFGRDRSVSSAGARGAFQFVGSTAQQYKLTNPDDDGQSADAAARLQIDNRKALTNLLGRAPTEAEVYLAHQQGAGGAAKLIQNPDLLASTAVGSQAAITGNGGNPLMTAGQFTNMWRDRFNRATPPPGAVNNAPPMPDRAAGLARLTVQLQNGELTPQQFEAATSQFERLYNLDTKMKADRAQEAFDEYVPKALSAPGMFDMDRMLSDQRLTGQQKSTLWTMVNKAVKGETDRPTEISQATRTQLLDDIRAGKITTVDPLNDAVAHRGLSTSDYNFVRARFDEAQTENGRSLNKQTTELFQAVEKDLLATPTPGVQNPNGGMDFFRWKAMAYGKIAEAQKSGKVGALLDPNSPDFLGAEDILKQYRSSLQDALKAKMARLGGGETAPKPETTTMGQRLRNFFGGAVGGAGLGAGEEGGPESANIDLSSVPRIRAAFNAGKVSAEEAAKALDDLGIEVPGYSKPKPRVPR